MKIHLQDRYHGPALMQIVEHNSFTAVNKSPLGDYGHYVVNQNTNLFVKLSTASHSPWLFNYQPRDLRMIRLAHGRNEPVFVALVCGSQTICGLNIIELGQLVDLNSSAQQWIRVEVPTGGSCHVRGSRADLTHAVPHNAYPNKLFA